KGTHLIIPQVAPHHALFAAIPDDRRIFVMVPWKGYSLLGPTDTDFTGDPATVRPEPSDMDYLLAAANRVLSHPIEANRILGSFAGVRALVMKPDARPSSNTRGHRFHRDPWAGNIVSVCGGKLTTARALGEKLLDELAQETGPSHGPSASRHPSRQAPLPGGHTGPFDAFVQSSTERASLEYGLPKDVAERIVRTYGSRWLLVLDLVKEDKAFAELLPGTPTLLAAEVEFAIRHEMAVTVEDFLLRRSGLNWAACTPLGAEAAPAVARIFAGRYGWDDQRRSAELGNFAKLTTPADRE
ncbi:MAG: FAD-dependent oxidoreductase, partial [Acidobacteria bacterium]|nr:FAD-dependent oxidoreductase [Acidobacteriota bacterium]